jgi:hypothetical protein
LVRICTYEIGKGAVEEACQDKIDKQKERIKEALALRLAYICGFADSAGDNDDEAQGEIE